jgi:prepilin-type N-terminal cleavage/methylation domain-containing protein
MRLASAFRGSRASSGFSLIEVLIALTLLGIALLLGMDLVLQNPRVVRRLDGERQAFRAMEAVRVGVIPLENADLGNMVTAVGAPAPKDLTIAMQVGPAGLPGLYQVTLTAKYSVLDQKYTKKLQTMVWSPPPPT